MVGATDLLWSVPWQVQVLHGAFMPTPDATAAKMSRMAASDKGRKACRANLAMLEDGLQQRSCQEPASGLRVEG